MRRLRVQFRPVALMKCKHLNIQFWKFIAECTDCGQKAFPRVTDDEGVVIDATALESILTDLDCS